MSDLFWVFGYMDSDKKQKLKRTNSFEGGERRERKMLNLGLIEIEMLMGHIAEITGRSMLLLQM